MIGIAVIGAGHWGPNLVRNFHDHETSEVLWVIDRDPDRLAQVLEHFPETKTSTEVRVAYSDERVDAVVIATPTVTHYELTKLGWRAESMCSWRNRSLPISPRGRNCADWPRQDAEFSWSATFSSTTSPCSASSNTSTGASWAAAKEILSLPIYPEITSEQQERVVEELRKAIR